MKKRKSRR